MSKQVLLSNGNPKLAKSINEWYYTIGLHLAPALQSGHNTCAQHTTECAATCLHFAGRGAMQKVQQARIRRTKFFFEHRQEFLAQLKEEITDALVKAKARGLDPAIRLNCTSDIRWELYGILQAFPDVQFYDYSKLSNRTNVPTNYHLTYSFSGHNLATCLTWLKSGRNVAVPFLKMPDKWQGYPVINGDEHDLRFLDAPGSVVGLKAKGLLRRQPSSIFLGDNTP